MKPDVKRILTKLSENKVELATQKIDLAITDDLFKMLNQGKEGLKTLEKIQKLMQVIKKGDSEADKINRLIDKLQKLPMQIANILDKAERSAKDLGVAPKAITDYAELDKLYEKLESGIKVANDFRYSDLERFVK